MLRIAPEPERMISFMKKKKDGELPNVVHMKGMTGPGLVFETNSKHFQFLRQMSLLPLEKRYFSDRNTPIFAPCIDIEQYGTDLSSQYMKPDIYKKIVNEYVVPTFCDMFPDIRKRTFRDLFGIFVPTKVTEIGTLNGKKYYKFGCWIKAVRWSSDHDYNSKSQFSYFDCDEINIKIGTGLFVPTDLMVYACRVITNKLKISDLPVPPSGWDELIDLNVYKIKRLNSCEDYVPFNGIRYGYNQKRVMGCKNPECDRKTCVYCQGTGKRNVQSDKGRMYQLLSVHNIDGEEISQKDFSFNYETDESSPESLLRNFFQFSSGWYESFDKCYSRTRQGDFVQFDKHIPMINR